MSLDHKTLLEKIQSLEQLELVEQNETSEDTYKCLMIYYTLNDEALKAKFLWKRIPQDLKTSNSELSKIWSIVQLFIQRNYSLAFERANQITNFSNDEIRKLFSYFIENMRENLFNLVQVAYSSIDIKEFASLLQLDEDKIIKIALQNEWKLDENRSYLIPKKLLSNEVLPIDNQFQMEQLTKIVSFIET